MSIHFGNKITMIKEAEGLNRPEFCNIIDIPIPSMRKIEAGDRQPRVNVAEKICKAFPQYTLWLMTDQTNPEAGQISPDIKKAQKDES